MPESIEEPEVTRKFREWFVAGGGSFHPHVRYTPVNSGYAITSSEVLESDAIVVSCPFSLAVTPALSRRALSQLLGGDELSKDWSERQLLCCYIAFHWILEPTNYPSLIHKPYIDTLPRTTLLRTPLHFTNDEMEALRGTNMYGATADRRQTWQDEWVKCQGDVARFNVEWAEHLNWCVCCIIPNSQCFRERYLTASTYLSSRAFPSTLLSYVPSLLQTPESHPVLLPGVDSLNHARANPVSWLVRSPAASSAEEQTYVCLQTHTLYPADVEIFNNYGPKPNAELLLGYGFTLPHNPDDTLVLKLGGATSSGKRWEVGRGARGVEGLWAEIVDAVKNQENSRDEEDDDEPPAWSYILDASGILDSMATAMLERLPDVSQAPGLRADVAAMLTHYVNGQKDILAGLIAYAGQKEVEALGLAKADGVDVQLE
ncbi:SET domain-containing protein [Peniophora sp. CONT]|nr:SET domain-containing protein [Peniophora sp. CONT]